MAPQENANEASSPGCSTPSLSRDGLVSSVLEQRSFGRTGEKVSVIGLGGAAGFVLAFHGSPVVSWRNEDPHAPI